MPRTSLPLPKKDFLSRLPEKHRHAISLSVILILPVLLFYSTVLGDQQFLAHDTLHWRASAEAIYEYRAEHDGEEPLWSTNMFGGMPAYIVDVGRAVPHLDSLVVTPLRTIWPAVPYWILLGGLYFFFVLQGFRPFVAALGAVLIGFTTYLPIIIGAGHNTKFIAFSYIPWMLCGYWLITRKGKPGWGFLLLAVAATLEFRAGHPQVPYYFFYLFAGLFLFDTWRAARNGELTDWAKKAGVITFAVILGFLGTADQNLRMLEYSPYSIRGGSEISEIATESGLDTGYAFSWSQGVLETFTLLIPNLYGGSSVQAYWGEKPGTVGPHYMGAVAGLLFLIGLFRSKKPIVHLFAGIGFLTLSLSWGSHFPVNELWFNILPGLNKLRTPEMWLVVTIFCFSTVSIYGLQSCTELFKEGRQGAKKMVLPVSIALGIGLVVLASGSSILPYESERERVSIAQQIAAQNNLATDNPRVRQQALRTIETRFKPERMEMARADTFRYLLIAELAAGLIFMAFQSVVSFEFLAASLLLITAFDMLTAGSRYISGNSLVPASVDARQLIEQQKRPVDQFITDRLQETGAVPWRVLPLDADPFNNAIPGYFYPSIGGYFGAKLGLIQDVIDRGLFVGPDGLNMPVLDMLNVRYLTFNRPSPPKGLTEVYSAGNSRVYENENVLPKAWFVDSLVTVSSSREAFDHILPQQNFDSRHMAVVETNEPLDVAELTANNPESSIVSEVLIETYRARRITMSLSRSEPGFLVLSEIYYPPGWKAELNDEEIPIYKTNYLLRGMEIPAGEHTLQLSFNPKSHIWGSRISWISNIIQWSVGMFLLGGLLRRKVK